MKGVRKGPPKPTQFQSRILGMIAHSPLVKTYSADRKVVWGLANGREISEKCAEALIRNGWVARSGTASAYTKNPKPITL